MDDHRRALLDAFVGDLLRLDPTRVLDVGCGNGALLGALAGTGVFGVGCEPEARACRLAREAGHRVSRADAISLPHRTGAFHWAVLRHVPHHLPDPRRALAEAWRVAGRGVLVAEPWFDPARPGHRLAERLDRLLKRADRRRGMFHADALDEARLEAIAPPGTTASFTVHCPEAPLEPSMLEEDLRDATGGLPLPEEDLRELELLRDLCERGGIERNGTLVMRLESP